MSHNTQPLDFPKQLANLAEQIPNDTWEHSNPRISVHYAQWWENSRSKKQMQNGEMYLKHECCLSHKEFWLPIGAPAPCIVYDRADGDDELSPSFHVVHPKYVIQGETAIREKMRERITWIIDDAEEALKRAQRLNALLGEELGTEWPSYWQQSDTAGLFRVLE